MMKNLICISAPSGSGKTTICKAVRDRRSDLIWSVSCTTREPRRGELNGEDYNFISKSKFNSLVESGKFAEWENVHGEYYGTLSSNLNDAIRKNKILLLELDVKGTMSIIKLYPKHSYSIFIVPPGVDHLRNRLIKRGSETIELIEKRLRRFNREMMFKDRFDRLLINDNIEVAIDGFLNIITKIEKGKSDGNKNNTT